jgi:hypothetical protein
MRGSKVLKLSGAPIGAVIPIVLAQHKVKLGLKHITKATVITNDEPERTRHGEQPVHNLHVFYQIDDVSVDEITSGAMEVVRVTPHKSSLVRGVSAMKVRDGGKQLFLIHKLSLYVHAPG